MFGRVADGQLLQWSWDGTHGWSPFMQWGGPKTVGWVGSNPAALLHRGEVQVYAWDADGRRLLRIVPREFSIGTATWDVEFPAEPPRSPATISQSPSLGGHSSSSTTCRFGGRSTWRSLMATSAGPTRPVR